MLVKLTTGVDFLCQQASSYLNKGKAAAVEGNINWPIFLQNNFSWVEENTFQSVFHSVVLNFFEPAVHYLGKKSLAAQ